MDDITTLYKFPTPINDGSGPWDAKRAVQPWFNSAIAVLIQSEPELASTPYVYTTWDVNVTTGVISFPTITTTMGLAAVPNVPPPGFTSVPGNATIAALSNPPIDLSKLPAGATIVLNPMAAFNGLPLIQLAGAPNPAIPINADPTEAEILADVRDIDKRMGGTPV